MQNGAIIYKCENPMNGYCSNSMKSQNELSNVENEIKTQNPQWVLSNVHKKVKVTQKCEKPQGEASIEAWSTKKWRWREWRR